MGLCLAKNDPSHPDYLQDNPPETNPNLSGDDGDAHQIDIENMGGSVEEKQPDNKVSLADFEFVKVLGRGSFGKVMLVQLKGTQKLYAMKIIRKDMVEKRNQRVHTRNERVIMGYVKNPFIVQLFYAFQTKVKLYLIMDFMIGGELFFHLRRSYRFTEERAKFYSAEIVLALDYLHQLKIVYRDLKPENVLIGEDGHIKLTDFGLSKTDLKAGEKTNTFCGTPEYLAPEILLGQGHNQCVDWWSLGALLYEMLSGAPPFYSKDKTVMFRNRLEKPIEMKQWFSPNAISILGRLLDNNPSTRLGNKGGEEVKRHPFFAEVNWNLFSQKKIEPPFKPKVNNETDLRHFDQMFTDEPVQDTPLVMNGPKIDEYDKFTYQKQIDATDEIKNDQQFVQVNHNFSFAPTTQK